MVVSPSTMIRYDPTSALNLGNEPRRGIEAVRHHLTSEIKGSCNTVQVSLAIRGVTFLRNLQSVVRLELCFSLVICGFPLFSGPRIVETANSKTANYEGRLDCNH